MIDISNQVVLITGGSRGIGAATALIFAKAGADVAILYQKNDVSAEKLKDQIINLGRKALTFSGNIENYGDCKSVVRSVVQKFKEIDILINNAGIWKYGAIGKMSPDVWNRTIDINLTGTFNMCNLVVPIMKKRKYGRIINIASTAGQRGEAFYSHYAASKGGIIAFTKSIAVELIKSGIWVNCVAPGWVKTDMVLPEYNDNKSRREILKTIPRGKIAQPEEIANTILFLASSLSNNIVGEILNVNGGSVLCG